MKKGLVILTLFTSAAFGKPTAQMEAAFKALTDMVPFLTNKEIFLEKSNQKLISKKIEEVRNAFKSAKHDELLKEDLFAPSYVIVNQNLDESLKALKAGNTDYAHWRLKELTSLCLDCHTRMPKEYSSRYEMGELTIEEKKYSGPYNLGIAQLIVRRSIDAKTSFTKAIDEMIMKKDFEKIDLPFKQMLLIETKILKRPKDMVVFIDHYLQKNQLPDSLKSSLNTWKKSLLAWSSIDNPSSDKELKDFISKKVEPLKVKASFDEEFDVDTLIISGLLSNYLFYNPKTVLAPEINYWIGWTEKHLKREDFFGSGDLFLKQCIKRYPENPIASKCLDEYKESVEFEFSGSSGTNIPQEIKLEIIQFETLIKQKKARN